MGGNGIGEPVNDRPRNHVLRDSRPRRVAPAYPPTASPAFPVEGVPRGSRVSESTGYRADRSAAVRAVFRSIAAVTSVGCFSGAVLATATNGRSNRGATSADYRMP